MAEILLILNGYDLMLHQNNSFASSKIIYNLHQNFLTFIKKNNCPQNNLTSSFNWFVRQFSLVSHQNN